jgi:hypothetical protein
MKTCDRHSFMEFKIDAIDRRLTRLLIWVVLASGGSSFGGGLLAGEGRLEQLGRIVVSVFEPASEAEAGRPDYPEVQMEALDIFVDGGIDEIGQE